MRFACLSLHRFPILAVLAGCLLWLLPVRLPAQYFTETFDDISTLWTAGWAQQNRSTSPGSQAQWFQGDPGIFLAHDGGDTAYIASNYNALGGSGTISNWLFTPVRTFTNGEKLSFWTRTVDHPNYPDRLQFRLSQNGASTDVGTTASSVGDFSTLLVAINPTLTTSGYPNHWTEYKVIVSGLTGPTQGRAALRYFVGNGGPSGANSEYIGIDSFAYYLPPAGDLKVQAIRPMEYTQMPVRHPFPGPYIGTILNDGSTTVVDAQLQVNVYNSVGTQVYTVTGPAHAAMAPGGSVTDSLSAATGLLPDAYTLEYIALHPALDGNHANDTLRDHFTITPLTYARDNGVPVGAIGIGAYVGGYVGQEFTFYHPDNLDSIRVHVARGYTGKPIAATIWNMAGGLPWQLLESTDTLLYTTDSAADYVLPVHGGPLSLPAGDFVVAMVEFDSTLHVGMAASVFTPGTTWLSWPTLPNVDWANVEVFGLPLYNHAQMIRPVLSACDLAVVPVMTPPSTPSAYDGTAQAIVTGGTPPYTYLWSNGATAAALTGLPTSALTVTVTDAAGCATHAGIDVMIAQDGSLPGIAATLHPNPNDGRFQVQVQVTAPAEVTLRVIDLMGKECWNRQALVAQSWRETIDLHDLPGGVYLVQLQADGQQRVFKVQITP